MTYLFNPPPQISIYSIAIIELRNIYTNHNTKSGGNHTIKCYMSQYCFTTV